MRKVLQKINIAWHICTFLCGKEHKFVHRVVVGITVMVAGVIVAKTIGHHPELYIAVIGDTIGYGLHGVGLIPVVEKLIEMS